MLQRNLTLKRWFGVFIVLLFTLRGFSAELGVVFKYHYSDDTPLSNKRVKLYGESQDSSVDFVKIINNLRESAGLIPLLENGQLEKAAQNHVDYLIINSKSGHFEDEQDDGFTGATPMDRGRFAGYEPSYYSENLTIGFSKISDSIDALMQSIYHRFGFLDFYINEVGISSSNLIHNYNMGNRGDILKTASKNPAFALWPPNNYKDAQVSFANFEYPNPLKNEICVTGGVTGNPISIQFNPSSQSVTLDSFRLFDGDEEIPIQTILTKDSDPNGLFRDKEFAIFPASPLEINSKYRVVFRGLINGEPREISWSFKTRNYPFDRYRVRDGGVYQVQKNKTYILHIIPNDCSEDMSSYEYSGDADVEFISLDIIKITPRSDIHFKTGPVEFDLALNDEDDSISSDTPTKNGDLSNSRVSNELTDLDLTIEEDEQSRVYTLSGDENLSEFKIWDKSVNVAVDKTYNTLDINLGKTYIRTDREGKMIMYYENSKIVNTAIPLGVDVSITNKNVKCIIKNMPERLRF